MTPAQLAVLKAHAFKPGHNVNPGGMLKEVKEVRRLFGQDVHEARELCLKFMRDEDCDVRVRADMLKLVLAYGLGPPPKQPVDDEQERDAVPTPEEAAAAASELRALRESTGH